MTTSPNLEIDYIEAAQSQKHVTMNAAIRTFDALFKLAIVDKDLTAPPVSPNNGEAYIVASPATGLWAGQENNIAAYQDDTWFFYTSKEGWIAYVIDESVIYSFVSSVWTPFNADTLGVANGTAAAPTFTFKNETDTGFYRSANHVIGVTIDGSARFQFRETGLASLINGSAASPAYSWQADPDTGMYRNAADELAFAAGGNELVKLTSTQLLVTSVAPLFNNAGDSVRVTYNKNAVGDDAGFIMQTAFSTRAFMGLLANDDLTIKVSPDGSAFKDAIIIDKDNGAVNIVQGAKFKSYCNYRQYIAADTWTKVDTNNERYDKNSDYDTGTKRFDARIPGVYHFDAVIEHSVNGTVPTSIDLALYVNGAIVAYTTRKVSGTIEEGTTVALSEDLELAATDYVELYVRMVAQDGYVQADTNCLSGHYIA